MGLLFRTEVLPSVLTVQMTQAGVVSRFNPVTPVADHLLHRTVRVSSLGDDLFFHSVLPTVQSNAVFFGPDTFRFTRFIQQTLTRRDHQNRAVRLLDMGCGSGTGDLAAAQATASVSELTLNDINPQALVLSGVNAALAEVLVQWLPGDAMTRISGLFDVLVADPLYLVDADQRAYRDGGGPMGLALSVQMTMEALAHFAVEGEFLLSPVWRWSAATIPCWPP